MEEESRADIIDIINNEEPVKEEIKEEVKPKAKAKSRAKPKIQITKEPVEPVVAAIEEVGEKPKKVDKLKEQTQCPDCGLFMTVHTLKYIHKRRGFCKADLKAEPQPSVPEPVPEQPKTKIITEDTVNYFIKQNPDIVTNYLRNERAMKAQRKQMNARSILNNVV